MITSQKELLDIIKALDRKYLIQVAVLYGAVIIFFLLLLLPSCSVTASNRSKVQQSKSQVLAARGKITQALHLQKNRELFLDEIRLTERRFFSDDEMSQLLSMISDLAKKYNLQVTASRPVAQSQTPQPLVLPKAPPPPGTPPAPGARPAGGPSAANFYEPHDFEVGLSGGYHALGSFISALKKYEKIIQIRKLTVTGGKSSTTEQDINMIVSVFSKKPGT